MPSFESLYLLFPGRRNSGSSQLARSVFQSYPPLISSVLCPTRGWETKCLFLKGKSWDSTDQHKNVNHATKRMYSYMKKQKNQLAYLSHSEFIWPYYSVCYWKILYTQWYNWKGHWWITVYQVYCDSFKCLNIGKPRDEVYC